MPLTPEEVAATFRQAKKKATDDALEPADRTEVRKAINTPVSVPAQPIDHDPKRGFRRSRDFLTAVMKAYTDPASPLDNRLKGLAGAHIEKDLREQGIAIHKAVGSDEAAGIHDAYGGFLIPTGFSPNLLKIDPEDDPMGGRTTAVPMTLPSVRMPARVDKNHTTSVAGGITLTRRPETTAVSATRMEMEQFEMRATTLMGVSYASRELLEDSPISFNALLAAGFSDQFTYHIIKERISGTGVGEYEGVLNCPALVTVTAETGQAADTIVFQNVVKMRSRCWHYEKAVWIANHDCYPQLSQLKLDIGTGGAAMYTPSLREDRPDMLLGRPIIYSEYAKKIGDVGDLLLCNWSEYLEGTYQPLRQEESIYVRFVNHETTFKFWTRNDGRSWWRSALTPVESSQTLSPFVALAAR